MWITAKTVQAHEPAARTHLALSGLPLLGFSKRDGSSRGPALNTVTKVTAATLRGIHLSKLHSFVAGVGGSGGGVPAR